MPHPATGPAELLPRSVSPRAARGTQLKPGVARRLRFCALALLTIALGLLLQRIRSSIPIAPGDILGDALWAAMIYFLLSAVVPGVAPRGRIVAAIVICWCVEFSQLLRLPQLDSWRATTFGHLVLGSDFDSRDLLAYAAGVLLAAALTTPRRRGTSP